MDDSLLESLRSASHEDSSGLFTLDPQRALEKLRRYALPDPERYVVHLVEAAAMGGASEVRVRMGWTWTSVEFGGRPLREADLRHLLPGLLGGRWSTRHRLHPLALAVNALLGGLAREVVVEAPGVRAVYRPAGATLEAPGKPVRVNRVLVRRSRSRGLWNLMANRPEHDHLTRDCPVRPPRVTLDSGPGWANQPVHLPPALVRGHLWHPRVPLEVVEDGALLQRSHPSRRPFSAVLSLGGPPQGAPILVLCGGRVFPLDREVAPGVTAVVRASGLETDLTRSALGEGLRLGLLLGDLRAEALSMRHLLAAELEAIPAGIRPWALDHARVLLDDLIQEGRPAEAAPLATALAAALEAPGGPAHEATLYLSALVHHLTGNHGEARARALTAVRRRARRMGLKVLEHPEPRREPLLLGVSLKGRSSQAASFLGWLLSLEERVLGPEHRVTRERRAALERFGGEVARPPERDLRAELGRGPAPEVLARIRVVLRATPASPSAR